jgi:hypothetical protein
MAKLADLDYGYVVKVIEGNNAGKEGVIVYGTRQGAVGISFRAKPEYPGYDTLEEPDNLTVILENDSYEVKKHLPDHAEDVFEGARFFLQIYK